MNNDITVSVAIITYQHEEFIERALKGVLMQKTNFKYEIVIADDCSTDNTRAILKSYKRKYSDKIKLILQRKNLGPSKNEECLLNQCKGKYIAFCDGDDFWTDENKLQIQVDFLENNKDYSGCFHNIEFIRDDFSKEAFESYKLYTDDICDYKLYFERLPMITTSTFIFRNMFLESDDIKYYRGLGYITDRVTFCLVLKYGKIKYIDRIMASYRYSLHGKSFCSREFWPKLDEYASCIKTQAKIVPKKYRYLANNAVYNAQKGCVQTCLMDHAYLRLLKFWFTKVNFFEGIRILSTLCVNGSFGDYNPYSVDWTGL